MILTCIDVHMCMWLWVVCLFGWLSMPCSAIQCSSMSFMWCCTYVAMQYVAIAFFKRNQFTSHTSANSKANREKSRNSWGVCLCITWYHQRWSFCIGISIGVFLLNVDENCMAQRERESEKEPKYLFRMFRYVIHIRLMCLYIFSLFMQTQTPRHPTTHFFPIHPSNMHQWKFQSFESRSLYSIFVFVLCTLYKYMW